MQFFVAFGAQRDQIQVVIIALLTAQLLVMDVKVFVRGAADLAFPAIALQHLFSQLVVRSAIKPEARLLGIPSGLFAQRRKAASVSGPCICSRQKPESKSS